MPSKPAAGDPDHPTFPSVRDAIGEDPARYLCTDLDPWPMLRGIDDRERAAAWLAVARNVEADDRIIEALERLVASLREGSE